jgi:hypothetical protein
LFFSEARKFRGNSFFSEARFLRIQEIDTETVDAAPKKNPPFLSPFNLEVFAVLSADAAWLPHASPFFVPRHAVDCGLDS